MLQVVRCIYPKIWRIPENYSSKCVLSGELFKNRDCKIHVLTVVCGSQLLNFSPYDSALILNLLCNNGCKDESNLKRVSIHTFKTHPLYKPAINRVVDSVVNYRPELFPYFFRKFAELHEQTALRALISVVLESGSLKNYNLNTLIELSYLASHHIPSCCFDVSANLVSHEPTTANTDYTLYHRFYNQLVISLVPVLEHKNLNKVLVYKLVYSLATIPFKLDCRAVYIRISGKLSEIIDARSWEPRYVIRVFAALHKLDLLDTDLLTSVYNYLEPIVCELGTKDLKLLESVASALNDRSSHKLKNIVRRQLDLYKKLNVK